MSKPKRKPRPSMAKWFWTYDWCCLCKNKNNCNQCKFVRNEAKSSLSRKDKRQILKGGEHD